SDNIIKIRDIYFEWKEIEGFSKIITLEEAKLNDYNLSPSRYIAINEEQEIMPIEDILVELDKVEEERNAIDKELKEILNKMGFEV
ncbi:MAG: N-6 DNA methylase, partial [Caldisericum sp.]|uniref:N-6 DNA methylase n=1 Tax=Caldisericum sp. TaxID=2499687 RepID=UPI003D0D7D8D